MTGAFVPWIPVTERAPTAGGPLAGLRLAVKDVIDVAGLPTGAGHPRWLATHPPAERDAPAVARLRAAGAVLVGKTHTDELAYSLAGTNAHYGTPPNPAAPGHVPGGSSSGTASAVAAGLADIGLGTDTAGSIRVPASYTGLYGLRPTHARVSREGVVPLAPSFDAPGLLTRDLATLRASAAALLTGSPSPAPPARLLAPADLWTSTPELADALATVSAHLPVERAPLFADDRERDRLRAAFSTVQAAQMWESHGGWITRESPAFGPGVAARVRLAADVTGAERAEAEHVLQAFRERVRGVLVIPSTPAPAPRLGETGDRTATLRLTCLAPVLGAPAISVPAATRDGLPLGLSLVGEPGRDESLLDLCAMIAQR
ncbi:amidase family protein [Spirillospora sp. NPDC047279]|uniref:amidase family protein n=1 Tax=Spirillospora sp. NPDC047279 TaxID=3155478 RepID=UPI00340E1A07